MPTEKRAIAALAVRRPLGASLGLAVLIVFVLAGGSEAFSRTRLARRMLPTESVGCGQPQLDRKLALLRALSESRGPVDCLFLGSSQAYRGIDPAVFEQTFRDVTGQGIRTFNFGLGGLSESGEDLLARMLVSKFRPRLLVVGASAYGLDDDRGVAFAARLKTSPWILYHQGTRSLDGWLVEHSDAFRTYLGVRFWTDPMPRGDRAKILGMMKGMRPNGYGYSETGSFRALDEALIQANAKYAVAASHLESLARTLELKSSVELIVAEIPVHESVIASFGRREADYQDGLGAIERVAERQGVPFWRYPNDAPIPREGWADFQHLNRDGAAIYSRWLGRKLGEAVRQGQVMRAGA